MNSLGEVRTESKARFGGSDCVVANPSPTRLRGQNGGSVRMAGENEAASAAVAAALAGE